MARTEETGAARKRMLVLRAAGPAAFGQTPEQRLARQARRSGIGAARDPAEADLILRGDHVYGMNLYQALAAAEPGTVLVDGAGHAVAARVDAGSRDWAAALIDRPAPSAELPAGATAADARALTGRHNVELRKKLVPLLLPADDARRVEQALFDDSYKGVTDLVTKHVWPPLALPLTRWCARRGVTPNQVTAFSAVLVGVAFWLFWQGHFGIGVLVAWAMTLLDTVDGKLARVTLSASRFGNIFDHGIDLIHPPFWWWAWAVGCTAIGTPLDDGGWTLGIIVAGYVLQRVEEGVFLHFFGMHIHVWRRFDSLFRQVTARRNPNLLILMVATALAAPRAGLIAVAAWTAICFGVHLVRIIQAFVARRAGPLGSWLAEA